MKLLIVLVCLIFNGVVHAQTAVPYTFTLTWKPGSGYTGQIIYRDGTQIAKIGATDSTYKDTVTGTPGNPVCYEVSGFTSTAETVKTNKACMAMPGAMVPAVSLQVTTGPSSITVNWTAPAKPNPKDWVGLYLSSSTDRQFMGGNEGTYWVYTKGASKGTFTTTPPANGTYNFRYLVNDSFTSAYKSYDIVVRSSSTTTARKAVKK